MKIAPEFRIYFAKTEEGTWLAASNEAPFFCFEGDSEEEVGRLAAHALDKYEQSDLPPPVMKSATLIHYPPDAGNTVQASAGVSWLVGLVLALAALWALL